MSTNDSKAIKLGLLSMEYQWYCKELWRIAELLSRIAPILGIDSSRLLPIMSYKYKRLSNRGTAMFNLETISRADLEVLIIGDDTLYAMFDEDRLLNNGYTMEEMKEIVQRWIEAGDECSF